MVAFIFTGRFRRFGFHEIQLLKSFEDEAVPGKGLNPGQGADKDP